ncbi:YcgL domain-containing protein [Pasteurella dagmatis]|uniref:YcgL domain-containing protein HMPREF0621_1277 n=1 Tax=Pasteurella dagmatis ATCC 43325 TaxID=667128 RepID=C9PQ95_9PAST|nr:YcgL domain-containing protein [Pasteurella dagmatis]EEX50206.1 YcgL domain protein [Pasteurella dagmatis ATCC 43325]SNV58687.1 membrane protein [Pasteurella dagmatis]
MLCAIYKSKRKIGTYLYVEKRDQFNQVPDVLREAFGTPIFVMMFNLNGEKPLVNADKEAVLKQIQEKGFYLQIPKEDDWLFKI